VAAGGAERRRAEAGVWRGDPIARRVTDRRRFGHSRRAAPLPAVLRTAMRPQGPRLPDHRSNAALGIVPTHPLRDPAHVCPDRHLHPTRQARRLGLRRGV